MHLVKRLDISGIAPSITAENLHARFGKFGKIKELTLTPNKGAESTAVLVLAAQDEKCIQQCIGAYNKRKWLGHQLQVSIMNNDGKKDKKNKTEKKTPDKTVKQGQRDVLEGRREDSSTKTPKAGTWYESSKLHQKHVKAEPTVDFNSDEDVEDEKDKKTVDQIVKAEKTKEEEEGLFEDIKISRSDKYEFSDSESDTPDFTAWTNRTKKLTKKIEKGQSPKKAKLSVEYGTETKISKTSKSSVIDSNSNETSYMKSEKTKQKKLSASSEKLSNAESSSDESEDFEPKSKKRKLSSVAKAGGVETSEKPEVVKKPAKKPVHVPTIKQNGTSSRETTQLKTIPKSTDKKKQPTAQERNAQRLQAVRQRERENMEKKNVIQQALANLDKPNKKVVFDSDDDDVDMKPRKLPETSSSEKLVLFNDSDSDGEEEIEFKEKQQFAGKKGAKLMALQSHIGMTDERFTVDRRFLDNKGGDTSESSSEEEREGDEVELEGEKDKERNMKLLSEFLGTAVKAKPKDVIPDMNQLRVTSVENLPDPMPKQLREKKVNKSTESKTNKSKSKIEDEPIKLPEVSSEKMYEFSSQLKDAFGSSDGQGFTLFSSLEPEDSRNSTLNLSQEAGSCSSDESGDDISASEADETAEPTNEVKPAAPAQSSSKSATSTFRFFIVKDDPRLRDAVKNFCRHKSIDELRAGWSEKRKVLYDAVKNKRKVALRRKKRDEENAKKDENKKFLKKIKIND